MKERPILFSGPMVRAILDGRKAMTRRVVKPQDLIVSGHPTCSIRPCPYGAPGDRLWVRETWTNKICGPLMFCGHRIDGTHYDIPSDGSVPAIYRADYLDDEPTTPPVRWKPSRYMPRWASRITLEITGLRVERLNEVSEEDAVREGVENIAPNEWRDYRDGGSIICPCGSFRSLWRKIKGRESWDANPWVWVIEFRKVEK